MRSASLVGCLVAVVAVAGLATACGDERTRVVAPAPNSPSAPTGQPFVVSLEIIGPDSVPPGQSAQFTAVARFSDGSRQPAEDVTWGTKTRVAVIDRSSGLATAGPVPGEDVVIAQGRPGSVAGTVYSSKEILVLPGGTFRMVGTVREDVPPGAPIVGAQVELTNGPSGGSVTDGEGHYRLYGVPTSADVRVSRDGYQPQVRRLQLTSHQTHDFQLALAGARLELTGSYLLTLEAACATSTPVREDLRRVAYAAVLTQDGPIVDVQLTDVSRFRGNIARRGNRFSGRVDAAGATFDLGENFYPYNGTYEPSTYPSVVERIPDGTFLTLDGTAVARGSTAALVGTLNGFFAHYSSRFPNVVSPGASLGTCYSSAHRFTLTRQ